MINKIFALPVIEQLTPVLSRRQLDDLDLIVVDHPQVKASFALQGAHLLSWKPVGEEEVLWLSNNTPFKTGVALRGGVPICWPWFGPAAQQGLPSHGFARNLPWALKAHNEDDNGVMLTFELQSSEATRKYWPHDFTLLARFKVGKTCEIELEAHASLQPHPRSTAILTLATSPTLRSADSAIGLLIKLTTLKKVSWPAVYKPFRTVPIAFTSILKHVA